VASGFDKGALRAENIFVVSLNGEIQGNIKPSAETPLHLALYRFCPMIQMKLRRGDDSRLENLPDLAVRLCRRAGRK
jgi:hypothetical protein